MREGLKTALVFLTRFPLTTTGSVPLAAAVAWFPVVGALLGAMAGGLFAGLTLLGMTSFPAAIVVLAALIVMTGALHEDGLADCADGLGPHDRARRLEVMRDSRIGSFGTLALLLVTLARLVGLAALWDPAMQIATLVVVGAASRGAMTAAMAVLPDARRDGLAARAGTPETAGLLTALALPTLLAVLLLDLLVALKLLAAAVLATAAWTWIARRAFGGRTGDVLGAAQQLAEAAMLLTVTTLR